MAFVFELPEIGEGVVEGEVVAWKVKVGERVAKDQPLCEIMTDKATVEISSPRTGIVQQLFGKPGDIIKVHSPLAEIDTQGTESAPVQPATKLPESSKAEVAPKLPAPSLPTPAPNASESRPTRAAPAVRRHARQEGIDIANIAGSGPNGRVTHTDIENFSVLPKEAPLPLAPVALPQRHSVADQRVKIIGLRRKIAEQMVRSKHTAPHFTYVEEVDCTRLVELRERLKPRAEKHGVKLTYIPIIMKACSIAFRSFPNINAIMDESSFELIVRGEHHIGVATDTPHGLVVPNIKNVETKSILQIAIELQDLLARVRIGKGKLEELTGGTFTVTGVGSLGGVLATPILNVPEVSILGINAIRDQAVVRDGQIVARKMMFLSPSFDHRIIDGMVGARFTAELKAILEEPESLLLELA